MSAVSPIIDRTGQVPHVAGASAVRRPDLPKVVQPPSDIIRHCLHVMIIQERLQGFAQPAIRSQANKQAILHFKNTA